MEPTKVDRRQRVARRGKTDDAWKEEVMQCLTCGGQDVNWGCLSRGGVLFKIRTLTDYNIPTRIVSSLEKEGLIVIKPKDTHYSSPMKKAKK